VVTTSLPPTTAAPTGVAVPDVLGQKIAAARLALHDAGLRPVNLNTPCHKGTLASQSVVDALALPGKKPAPATASTPIQPGDRVPVHARVGITWSGCYGDVAVVPDVVGQTFDRATHAIDDAGLTWACYSIKTPAGSTSTTLPSAAAPSGATTPTTAAPTTPNNLSPTAPQTKAGVVRSQDPHPGGQLRPGATVVLTMHTCPQ
jgi:beta-lactam-binding protein with PASTA domain